VIAVDLPGHGQSDKPKVDYSMEYFARSVDAVMKEAGVDKARSRGSQPGNADRPRVLSHASRTHAGIVVVDGAS
jgi:pimeloyl-ACP methyl ester carboxylesterase